jgi:type IV secretion system protein VirB8
MTNSISQYIEESKAWFFSKHIKPLVDTVRIMEIMFLTIVSIAIIWSIINTSTATIVMKLPIYVQNIDDNNHFIKNLFEQGKSVDEVFAKYMIERYVKLRESYAPNLLESAIWSNTLTNISSISSNKAFNDFINQMLPSKNPESPIIKYRFSTSIVPVIDSIAMTEFSGRKPISAQVHLKCLECSHKYNTCIANDFVIYIDFEINAHPRFRFRVQDYRKSPVTKTNS